MAIIQIAALLIVILYAAYIFKERIVDTIPVIISLLVLFLYVLAFFNSLSFIDMMSGFILFAAAVLFCRKTKEQRRNIIVFIKSELSHPGCIIGFVTILIVTICVSGKLVTWWDDYNFWATDVKSIFYLDGFAGKYKNVAAEFGDYPPGTQMLKWWFLHLSPDTFKEGLMFAGYYVMNLAYLMPLLRKFPGKDIVLMVFTGIALWIFPNVAEQFYLSGDCADLTMAVVYGAFLAAVMDEKGHDGLFYYVRLTVYLMVLVLLKNVGFMWAAFAIIFFCIYRFLVWKKTKTIVWNSMKKERVAFAVTILLPIITQFSWLIFCLSMRRVAKLTGTAVNMAVKGVNIPDYADQLIHSFTEAFFRYPLHRWETWAIDMTPFALYVILCLFVFLFYKKGMIEKTYAWLIGIFFAISGMIFYSINLISHLTIFAIEEQYLEPFGMVSSIERYGAPFLIGGLYLLGFLWLNKKEQSKWKYFPYFISFILIFICIDHKMAYEGLIGYRDNTDEVKSERQEILSGSAERFINVIEASNEVKQIKDRRGMRILYFRDGKAAHRVQDTYIGFEASPVSVMFGSFWPEEMEIKDIAKAVLESHAEYLYIDEVDTDAGNILDSSCEGGKFHYDTLYRLDTTNGLWLMEVD